MAEPQRKADHVHAITASFLGWTLDAFDFFIVVFVLTDLGKVPRVGAPTARYNEK